MMKRCEAEVVNLRDCFKNIKEVPKIAVAVDRWYDRSRREWVLYPIDAEGNQLTEARYAFTKKEAIALQKDLEAEYVGKEVEW